MVFSVPLRQEQSWKLTDAEKSVLAEVVAGRSNLEIARTRGTSERTIANQVTSIMRKIGGRSRSELALIVSGTAPSR